MFILGREYLTDKTVPHNCPDITLFEKTNKTVYLIDVSISNLGNLEASYTEKMRKYAELSIEVKQQWKLEAVYTHLACHCICSRCHSSHTTCCPQVTRLNRFAVLDHTEICSLKYMQHSYRVLRWQYIAAVSDKHTGLHLSYQMHEMV